MLNLTYNKSIYKDSDIKWGDGLKLKLRYATPAVNGGPAVWGDITGELSSQADLYSRLTEITDSVGKKADKTYVDEALSEKTDKSDFQSYTAATEEKIDSKADKKHTHTLKDITDYVAPDLTPYALKTDVANKLDSTAYTPYNDSQIKKDIKSLQDTKLDTTAYTPYNDTQVKSDIKALQDTKLDTTAYTPYNDSQIKSDIKSLQDDKLDATAYTPYDDAEIKSELAGKADTATTYTKTDVDSKLTDKLDKTGYTPYNDAQIKADIKSLKSDKLDSTAYTPYDDSQIKTDIAKKADTATTYTKTDVDSKLAAKLDTTAYTPYNDTQIKSDIKSLQDDKLDSTAYTPYNDSQVKSDISALKTGKLDATAYTPYNDSDIKADIADKLNTSDFNAYTAETATKLSNAGKVDDVKVNGASVVTDKVANIDLSSYALKTDIPTGSTTGSSDSSYTDEKEEVTSSAIYNLHERIEKVEGSIGSKAEKTDISDLRGNLKEKVNQKRYDSDTEVIASAIIDLDKTKLDTSAYTKVDTSAFAKTTDVDNKLAGKADTANTYTKAEVDSKIPTLPKFRTINGNAITGDTTDITTPTKTSQLTNDSGFLTTSDKVITGDKAYKLQVITQAAYDALTTKDDNTIYLIQG